MSRVDVAILGPIQVTHDGAPVAGFAYDKVRALLAYLVVEGDRPWRRESLAALLWPDQDERAARHSLSQALFSLRRALDDRDASAPLLLVTSDTVQINATASFTSDLRAFTALLDACDSHPHRDATRCRACARMTEQAVELYRGDLLEGFTLPDSVLFDEWLLVRREQVRERALMALARLARFHEARDDLARAIQHARRLIALDPWREDAVRQLMRLLAWSGQRAAAIEQFARLTQRLEEDLGVEPELETRDLLARIRQGTETRASQAGAFARQREIPEQVTAFVGRERELAELSGLLLDGTCRLVTLTGPGGIGKTRLAIEAARNVAETFAGGVVFVPLAGLTAATLLPSAIASLLDAPLQGGHDERESLLHWLREREMLLVLDNIEHLLDGAGLIGDILDRAPDVQLLVTSRARLDLQGEWVVEVGGLSLPASSPGPAMSSAEQLFIQRAVQMLAGYAPGPEDRTAIARLCRLVEGLPLALEIAAGWLPVLSCAEIAGEVERSLDFLATTRRDVEPRHRSMQAVFDGSWELLSEQEQQVFQRLAVFRGGFGRDAAEQIAGATLPLLSALVGRSLLRRTSDNRYELHELLHQYAGGRLAAQPDDARAVRERHCLYFTDLISRRTADLRGAGQAQALADLESEIENLRAALIAAIEDARASVIADAACGFWLFCEITGRNRDIQRILRAAVNAVDGNERAATTPESGARALGRILVLAGSTFARTGEHEQGDALVSRGVAILRCYDAAEDIGLGLNFQAMYAHRRQDFERERVLLRESIERSATAGDRWVMAYSLNDLGLATLDLGDADEARRLQLASLAIFRDIGDRRGAAFALHNLGVVARHQEDDGATVFLNEALAIRQEIRHVWGIAETLIELGIVARESGDSALAVAHLRDGLRIAEEIHALPAILRALVEIAEVLASAGDTQRADHLLIDILRHPGADSQIRSRARELLGSAADAVLMNVAIAPGQPEDIIDARVASFLRNDPSWTSVT
jgi:predicted ATPase/DNA-binding SARP family transcriptional activator